MKIMKASVRFCPQSVEMLLVIVLLCVVVPMEVYANACGDTCESFRDCDAAGSGGCPYCDLYAVTGKTFVCCTDFRCYAVYVQKQLLCIWKLR